MTLACFIRYEIDPFQREAFAEYAARWGRIIPRCGGHCWVISCPTRVPVTLPGAWSPFPVWPPMKYRTRLKTDPEGRANFAFAQERRFIRGEDRTFVEAVGDILNIPAVSG